MWEDAGDRLFRERLGIGLADARPADVPRLFRAPELDRSFPSDRMLPALEATLRDLGYAVSRNKPYAGGFITEHYGNPAVGLHAIQLELNRAIYMDERRRERGARFAQVTADFAALADALAAVPLGDLGPFQAAAE